MFEKIGEVWVEATNGIGRWRTSGSKIFITDPWGNRLGDGIAYRVSEEYFTLTNCYYGECYEQTYIKTDIAEFRRSLGTVYINDPKLLTSSVYRDLIWYSEANYDEHLEFDGTRVEGNGLHRYVDDYYSYNDIGYYTDDDRLFLVILDCYWDWDYDAARHCTASDPIVLNYDIKGGGRGARLSINGDRWLPAEYDEYWDNYYYNNSAAKSRQRKHRADSNADGRVFSWLFALKDNR